jgi:aspartate aminotransferase
MNPKLSQRAASIPPSPTGAMNELVRRAGPEVIPFSAGESDLSPPSAVFDAARAAVDGSHSRYGTAEGQLDLRKAICDDSLRRRRLEHGPDQVIVGAGAKQILFALQQALLDPGDRVLIPTPIWPSYAEQVALSGGAPVAVRTDWTARENRLAPLIEEIDRGAKLIMFCSPVNPTGAVYREDELRALGTAAAKHGTWLVCDEVYGRFVYDGKSELSLLAVMPELAEQTIIVDSVSKGFAMPGWRVGWALVPQMLTKPGRSLQSQAFGHANLVAQRAARAALTEGAAWIEEARSTLERRRNRLCAELETVFGTAVPPPAGGLYVFPRIAKAAATLGVAPDDDTGFARALLERTKCAVMPGNVFGAPGHVRMCFGISDAQLEEGLKRLRSLLV